MRRTTAGAAPQVVVGIVVALRKLGESDRLIELIAADAGLVTLVARGARASRRRFAGILDLFVSLRGQVQPRRGLGLLVAADALDLRLGLRQSLEAIGRAGQLAACARRLSAPELPAPALAAALAAGLDRLAAGDAQGAVGSFVDLARAAGILPPGHCGICAGHAGPFALDPAAGTLACQRCAPRLAPLPPLAVRWLGGRAPAPDDPHAPAAAEAVVHAVQALAALPR